MGFFKYCISDVYLYYDGKEAGDIRVKRYECKEDQEEGCDCGTSRAGGDQKRPEIMTEEKAESEEEGGRTAEGKGGSCMTLNFSLVVEIKWRKGR